jgi:hypothetical protein
MLCLQKNIRDIESPPCRAAVWVRVTLQSAVKCLTQSIASPRWKIKVGTQEDNADNADGGQSKCAITLRHCIFHTSALCLWLLRELINIKRKQLWVL